MHNEIVKRVTNPGSYTSFTYWAISLCTKESSSKKSFRIFHVGGAPASQEEFAFRCDNEPSEVLQVLRSAVALSRYSGDVKCIYVPNPYMSRTPENCLRFVDNIAEVINAVFSRDPGLDEYLLISSWSAGSAFLAPIIQLAERRDLQPPCGIHFASPTLIPNIKGKSELAQLLCASRITISCGTNELARAQSLALSESLGRCRLGNTIFWLKEAPHAFEKTSPEEAWALHMLRSMEENHE